MPEVDPETRQPVSDAVNGPENERGGRLPDDPSLADASEDGGTAKPPEEMGDRYTVLPGEKPSEGGEV